MPFNIAKGSMPSPMDTDVFQMDECTKKAMAVLQDPAERLPGMSYVVSPDRRAAMIDAVSKYWAAEAAQPEALVAGMLDAFQATN